MSILLKRPPVFTSDGNQGFRGKVPPTGEDVILQYIGYHTYLQRISNRQSKNFRCNHVSCRGYQNMVGEKGHHT